MAYSDFGLTVDAILEQQLKRASSSPQSLALSTQDDEDEMQQFLDMVRKAPQVSSPGRNISRQDRLYEMARVTAGLAPVMPSIRESYSVDNMPAGRNGPLPTWQRASPYEPVRASPLVNHGSTQSITSFGSSSSLLDALTEANAGAPAVLASEDNFLDSLLSGYISTDQLVQQSQVLQSPMPHYPYSTSSYSPVMMSHSPFGASAIDVGKPMHCTSPLFAAIQAPAQLSQMGMGPSPISPIPRMGAVSPMVLNGLLAEERAIHRSKSAPTSPTVSPHLRRQSMLQRLPMSSHGRGSNGDVSGQRCNNCGATTTVLWRQCKVTQQVVCNPCGLYSAKHSVIRPKELLAPDSPIKRRVRRRKTNSLSGSAPGSAFTTPTTDKGKNAEATQEVPAMPGGPT